MNRRRIFLIAAVALTLLLTVGSGLVLRGQEEYVPESQVAQMDPERSQVYLSGSGYSVNKDQKKEHQEIEKQRKQKQQRRKPSQQQKQQARAVQRAKDGPKTKGPGDDPGKKETEKTSQMHSHPVNLEYETEPNRPNLIRLQYLHLLRTFVEVVTQRQHIIKDQDTSVLSPAFDVKRLRSLQHLSYSRNVN